MIYASLVEGRGEHIQIQNMNAPLCKGGSVSWPRAGLIPQELARERRGVATTVKLQYKEVVR